MNKMKVMMISRFFNEIIFSLMVWIRVNLDSIWFFSFLVVVLLIVVVLFIYKIGKNMFGILDVWEMLFIGLIFILIWSRLLFFNDIFMWGFMLRKVLWFVLFGERFFSGLRRDLFFK